MYCQRCKKQAATVHLTEIANGQARERHLCEGCATQQGVTPAKIQHTTVGELMAHLVTKKSGAQQLANMCCPKCHTTFAEFRNAGLLGCPADYDAFEQALVPLIERAHEGASHHVGKIPRRLGGPRPVQNDLVKLRKELTEAVDGEQYEKAARIRDHIRTLETQ